MYREKIITHTAQAHSEPSQTSKMEPFANMANYFCKSYILRVDYMVENFSQGSNFKSINRDEEISFRMLSDNNIKK